MTRLATNGYAPEIILTHATLAGEG